MARLNAIHPLLDEFWIYSFALRDEFGVWNNFTSEPIISKGWIFIDDNEVNLSFLEKFVVFWGVLSVLGENDSWLRMFCYVLTCFSIVCSINTDRDASSKKTSIESEKPLRRIESDNINRSKFCELKSYQGFCELKWFFIIFLEIDCNPFPCFFMRESRSLSKVIDGISEFIDQGAWRNSGSSTNTHADR